jgi:hypothetical protein
MDARRQDEAENMLAHIRELELVEKGHITDSDVLAALQRS